MHYGDNHSDAADVSLALQSVRDVIEPYEERMRSIENQMKLIELQRDLVGLESNLVAMNRVSLREDATLSSPNVCCHDCNVSCFVFSSNSFAKVAS